MDIYCPNCENACSEEAAKCPGCGHRLKSAAFILGTRFQRLRKRWWPGFILACAIGGCLGFQNINRQEKEELERIRSVEKLEALRYARFDAARRAQKMTLETISDWRPMGGFTAEISTRVQAMAHNASLQFTKLMPEDINLAFGLFGDLDLTFRDLVDLAIMAQANQLDLDFGEPVAVTKERVRLLGLRNEQRVNRLTGFESPLCDFCGKEK